jgi:adenylate cyclase
VEGQQRRMLRRAFNRYFSPHVVADILDNSAQVELGGKTIEATAFFSDIKDFTSFAEKCTPKDLVHFLNQYFSVASDVILKNEAMLDKYIGDAIMAIFGAPIPRPDNARVACMTALEVQEVLAAYHTRPERDPGMPVFVTRIGLHTGNMVIGNIGSSSRLDYTAIGDTVNVASRLEGVNKIFGTHIILSETTFEQSADAIAARPLDFLRVKGKAIPIRIFELVGRTGQISQLQADIIGQFSEGLQLYRQRSFSKAIDIFTRVQAIDPNPVPSTLYLKRCAELSLQTLPDDWDGVYTMTSK